MTSLSLEPVFKLLGCGGLVCEGGRTSGTWSVCENSGSWEELGAHSLLLFSPCYALALGPEGGCRQVHGGLALLRSALLCFFSFQIGSCYVALVGTCCIEQTGFKLTKICLPLLGLKVWPTISGP